jgi:hypothetical protein
VEIALTDPATGQQQTCRRRVRDDDNSFALTWNP